MHKNETELIKYWGDSVAKGEKAKEILDSLQGIFDKMKKDLYNLWKSRPLDGWQEIYYQRKALEDLEGELKRMIEDGEYAKQKIEEVIDARR